MTEIEAKAREKLLNRYCDSGKYKAVRILLSRSWQIKRIEINSNN